VGALSSLLGLGCDGQTTPAPIVLAHPPADPGGPPPDGSTTSVFAMRHVQLGGALLPDGGLDQDAWEHIGFDIDGKVTTEQSTDVCQLVAGAGRYWQVDGDGGIDNSFGRNVMPVLTETVGTSFEPRLNDSLAAGLVTNLLVVKGLGPGPTYSPMRAALLLGAPLGSPPTWSPSDVWPVDSSSLFDDDAGAPLLSFPGSYLDHRVFVAEPPSGAGELALGILDGVPVVLPLRHVQVAMTVSPDGSEISQGTVSAIIPLERLLFVVQALVGQVTTYLCTGSAFNSIVSVVKQAADILLDGSQDPSRPCDGISFGMAFDGARVSLGPPVPVAPLGDVCDDQ